MCLREGNRNQQVEMRSCRGAARVWYNATSWQAKNTSLASCEMQAAFGETRHDRSWDGFMLQDSDSAARGGGGGGRGWMEAMRGGAWWVGSHLTPCLTLLAFSSHVIGFGSLHPHCTYCLLTFFFFIVSASDGILRICVACPVSEAREHIHRHLSRPAQFGRANHAKLTKKLYCFSKQETICLSMLNLFSFGVCFYNNWDAVIPRWKILCVR